MLRVDINSIESNSFSFKGIQLDILFQFTKQIGANSWFQSVHPPGSIFGSFLGIDLLNRWQTAGDKAPIQKFTQDPASDAYNVYQNVKFSDYAYSNASFIRLKNFSLSYQFSDKFTNPLKIENLKIYIIAQNLFTITAYNGLDPENQNANYLALPPLKIITAGAQISL